MTKITVADFRVCGICRDARVQFFDRYADALDLSWREFVKNGATAEQLRAAGQHLDVIDKLEAAAMAREAKNGR